MTVDRQKVLDAFAAYIRPYDAQDPKVSLKIHHTYRVAALCEQIGRSIALEGTALDLAWLCGMLHDVGRFEQLRRFGTFDDSKSIDHARAGVQVLFEQGHIRDYLDDDSEDAMLRTAVEWHSAYRLPDGLDERTVMYCNILRDADKIDILRVNVETPLEDIYNVTTAELLASPVTPAVQQAFYEHHAVLRSIKQHPADTCFGEHPPSCRAGDAMSYTLEVCVDSAASALAAKRGGADRLELCADLIIGGTTPSLALVRQVKAETGLPVRALLRPRFGDFCYDRYELAQMAETAAALVQAGADGIVTGVLTPEGELDVDALRPIYAAARTAAKAAGRPVVCTLHRAFDVCKDPFAALEAAKALNLGTILTSGQAASAPAGASLLRRLVEAAGPDLEILVGAGVTPANLPALAAETGAHAFHMSGKQVLDSRMTFRREGVPMGLPGFSEFEVWQTSEETIRAARRVLNEL